uniref:Ig-like domain-containing protein n=1 Tax=Phocoena sinus TaxID=42100 RepID=A0A8C9E6L3_PHOSS
FQLKILPGIIWVSRDTYSVNQTEGPVTVSEGAPRTLHCTYQTSDSNPYLFWYVQYLNKAPQLLLKGSKASQRAEHQGFQATLVTSDSSFHLQKPSMQASDSAVYYCALSDTCSPGTYFGIKIIIVH